MKRLLVNTAWFGNNSGPNLDNRQSKCLVSVYHATIVETMTQKFLPPEGLQNADKSGFQGRTLSWLRVVRGAGRFQDLSGDS
jgi:hypothetical protein